MAQENQLYVHLFWMGLRRMLVSQTHSYSPMHRCQGTIIQNRIAQLTSQAMRKRRSQFQVLCKLANTLLALSRILTLF